MPRNTAKYFISTSLISGNAKIYEKEKEKEKDDKKEKEKEKVNQMITYHVKYSPAVCFHLYTSLHSFCLR